MSIGYACRTVGVPYTDLKSCTLKNANGANLYKLIDHNLSALENIIDYNIINNVKLFRIGSDLIPFGSSSVNNILWGELFAEKFLKIGEKIKESKMRVSMHPGQYTVLNSPDEGIVKRAIQDLNYHTQVLECLGVGQEHKIVLHIGGVYNDKKVASQRFITHYHYLDESVKRRLVIENDDKSYTIDNVLEIGIALNTPVIFDNLHHAINAYDKEKSDDDWIKVCKKTWQKKDGNQKIHYSQQDPLKKIGSHSHTIRIDEFIRFYEGIETEKLDIMLEVKDKNLSAVKCINATNKDKKIQTLEMEWGKYKYTVLESSPSDYLEIRKLLTNKSDYPVISFYNLIESALQKECTARNTINAALHIWGYFKNIAEDKEKNRFLKSIEDYKQEKTSVRTIKNNLWKMSIKYQQPYLLGSYYFVL